MERTEEQKIVQAPLILVFGGKDYEVKPLVIRDSRAWRGKLSATLGKLPQYAKITTDTPDAFAGALDAILVSMPDTIVDLVFQYAQDLKREEIEAEATEAEMATAFNQILKVAFPLARSMGGAMGNLSQ